MHGRQNWAVGRSRCNTHYLRKAAARGLAEASRAALGGGGREWGAVGAGAVQVLPNAHAMFVFGVFVEPLRLAIGVLLACPITFVANLAFCR